MYLLFTKEKFLSTRLYNQLILNTLQYPFFGLKEMGRSF